MNYIKLGEICSIKTGKLNANAAVVDGQYPFFTCSSEPSTIDSYSFDCECVLVAGNGDLNVKYYNGKFDAYQRTYVIESNDKNKFLTKYLYLYLESKIKILRHNSIGGVIKYIKLNNLTDLLVPNISVEEQQKIVNLLFKVDNSIKIKKEQITKIDELIKSTFNEMFGNINKNDKNFELFQLSEVCEKITDGTHDTPKRLPEGVLLITGKNIKENQIDLSNIEYVSQNDHKKIYQRCNPEKGDVLYTNIGVNFCVATVNYLDFEFSMKNVALLKPNKTKLNPVYLSYSLNYLRDKIITMNKAGGAQPFIGLASINKLTIPIPKIESQLSFNKFVDLCDEKKKSIEAQLLKLDELQESLMANSF